MEAAPAEKVSYRWLFWSLALLTALSSAWIVYDEAWTRRPWKEVQQRFNAILLGRDLPAEPIAVRQVTNPELGVVDRCHTCHVAIDRPGFGEDLPRELRTHPRRDELLGRHHPSDEVGCTPCHSGQGPQIKGVGHAPFDHGRNDHYWDRPMYTGAFVEASCASCHDQDDPIAGAEVFNRGRRLFEEHRCFGCHETTLVGKPFSAAPALTHLRDKSSAAFIEAWLTNPRAFRPNTRMPSFWPPPRDPTTGRTLSEGTDAYRAYEAQRTEEVRAVVAFLSTLERVALPDLRLPDLTDGALVARGRRLFDRVGCRGCHRIGDGELPPLDPEGARPDEDAAATLFGPNLAGIGEKASARWLAAWLENPRGVWPDARMPDLRLSGSERGALVAFLVSLRSADAPAATTEWPTFDDAEVTRGGALVQQYGCHGCHSIAGLEQAGQAGPDLLDYGRKTQDRIAWGDAHVDCARPTLECWTLVKIEGPRRIRGANLEPVMPDFGLSAEETEALAVFALANRREQAPASYRRIPPDAQLAVQTGERVFRQRNCRGCHEIGRTEHPLLDEEDGTVLEIEYRPRGGQIRRYYEDLALAPPPLTFAGEKLNYTWLDTFLGAPTPVRPWLDVRMPTFGLTDNDRTAVVAAFAAQREQPYPFPRDTWPALAAAQRPEAQRLFDLLQCVRCHQVSGAAGLAQGELAPNLGLVRTRLRPGWNRRWLLEPQAVQPGTRMPSFFPRADESDPDSAMSPCPDCFEGDVHRQIDALIGLLVSPPT